MSYKTQQLTTHAELMNALTDIAADEETHGLLIAVCMRSASEKVLYLLLGSSKSINRDMDFGVYESIGSCVASNDMQDMYCEIADGGSSYDESVQEGVADDLSPEQWAILGLI